MPAAFSPAIGSDSQRPFAQVVVGGLLSRIALSIFLTPGALPPGLAPG